MRREDWATWAESEAVIRRAGGRRRYNAQRRRQVQERRAILAAWFDQHRAAAFFDRGLPRLLAPAFGVHPSTIWRDLRAMLYPPHVYRFLHNGELLYTVCREYPGGPVVGVEDAEGNEIRGRRRRNILRGLPRYYSRRG